MARGKHGIQAANRLAQLDNELLALERAKVLRLEGELAECRSQLVQEKSERGSIILNRATELSSKAISDNGQALRDLSSRHASEMLRVAWLLGKYFRHNGMPPIWATEVLPILIPDNRQRNEYLDTFTKESTNA